MVDLRGGGLEGHEPSLLSVRPWSPPHPLLQILGTMDEELQIFRGQTEVEDDLCIIGPSQFKKAE